MEKKLKKLFKNKVVLITGGSGSLGNKLVEKILPFKPKQVRVFSRSEKPQDDMKQKFPECLYLPGDVTNYQSVLRAVAGCDIVLHLSASKHIIVAEEHPSSCVGTNVYGSANLINAVLHEGCVERCLAISTDKAVDPVNTYGMSKKLMENLFCEAHRKKERVKTVFSCCRYGNVLGSNMSVVPFWRKQVDDGKTVTVTDPDMTRFLFTLNDAVDLVFYALLNAKGGEIVAKWMRAVELSTLADAMTYGTGVGSKIIGRRHGEKTHEVLISEYEKKDTTKVSTKIGDVFIIRPNSNVSNVHFSFTSKGTQLLNTTETRELLRKEGWV